MFSEYFQNLHVLLVFQPLQLLRFIFSLLRRSSLSPFFDSFSPFFHVIHLFPCRRVQEAEKVANVGRTSWVSRVGCQTPLGDFLFPRARAWHAASRFVLSYCRVLSRRCVLTTAARPMHDPSGSGSLGYPAVPFVSPASHPPILFRLFVQRDAFIALVAAERTYAAHSIRANAKSRRNLIRLVNSLRPETRYVKCNQASRGKWLGPARNWIAIFFKYIFYGKSYEIIWKWSLLKNTFSRAR